MKRHSPTTTFVLGLWLGGSIFLVGVVTYNFVGIGPSFEANEKLAARAGFDPEDEAAKKTSVERRPTRAKKSAVERAAIGSVPSEVGGNDATPRARTRAGDGRRRCAGGGAPPAHR